MYCKADLAPDHLLRTTNVAKKTSILFASLTLAVAVGSAAHAGDDVLARIKPVGQVNVAGQAKAAPAQAAPAATAPAEAPAAPAQAAAPAVPAAAPAGGSDSHPGAGIYQAKGCAGCHGADGKTTIMPVYPKLAGQGAAYLLNQMKDIKSGTRHNGQTAVMKGIIAGVSEDEMKAIAEWLSTLQP